ncbi:MAG: hypothetical protein OFPII_34580 [Osedax symbiont Rs1]|nr:MAG: hypothetical protein OFPII_34580 [Osedax symbiont Rs1]
MPQANVKNFWGKLLAKKDLITEVDASRWSADNLLHIDKHHPGTSYTYSAGSLGDVSNFDAQFFGISPREAAAMDPQQRYLLEMSWEAIEHAGIKPSSFRKSDCGVFIGVASLDYSYRIANDLGMINSSTATGNTSSIASNRISYAFDLHGPSFSMDTACSSSLVAFHQACQSIISGEINTALTGGISLHLHPFGFIIFAKATMLSPTGRCHVFDESADGYVRSEGGGVFLLKDYDQAVADGDIIHAVVAASVVNTDGYKAGLTIPSKCRQTELLEKAYAKAKVSPDEIDYIEAHGTGTPVGDPIETAAIGQALGRHRTSPLPIGSVKSNLGHLETASGVAGLAKALLVIKHRQVPATIGINKVNPAIKTEQWNLKIVDQHLALKPEGVLTVGLNSFGFGGANAHLVLQSDTLKDSPDPQRVIDTALPIIVSAKSAYSLRENIKNLITFFDDVKEPAFYDVAWNYFQCKERLEHSLLVFAKDVAQAQAKLQQFVNSEDQDNCPGTYLAKGLIKAKGPVFIYSGNGCQWETMGKSMLASSVVFKDAVLEVDALFRQHADFSLIEELEGRNGADRFEYTEIAQPTLFAIQVATTQYLSSRGVLPSVVMGHSVGEVAAAWASGALSLDAAVRVIYYRSLWQGKTKGQGAMLAVGLGEGESVAILDESNLSNLHLAGVNSHRGVTLAGNAEELDQLVQILTEKNIFNVKLPLDYAFHSSAMDSIQLALLEDLADLVPRKTSIDFISTVSGSLISGLKLNNAYWWDNIRQPVQFEKALNTVIEQGYNCFVEVGAHPVLRGYQQDQLRHNNVEGVQIPTFTRNLGTQDELDTASAAVISAGAIASSQWFATPGKRMETPCYSWQLDSHWYTNTTEYDTLFSRFYVHPLLGAPIPLQILQWESVLDSCKYAWLADHKVGESVVFPGAGFIELALNAASYFRDEQQIEIEALEILAPLILEDAQSKTVQTKVDELTGDITIYSRTYSTSDQWVLNAKARACHQPSAINLAIKPLLFPTRAADFDALQHRQLALRAGLQYGPAFSAVVCGWVSGSEVIAKFSLPASIKEGLDSYKLHPGILDSAIQLVIHILSAEIEQHSGTAFIPVRVERLTINRNLSQQAASARLVVVKRSAHSLLARIELFDDREEVLACIEEVRFKAVKLYKSDLQEISYLNYQLIPAATEMIVSVDIGPRLNQQIELRLNESHQPIDRFEYEVSPLLENMLVHSVHEALSALFVQYPQFNATELAALNLQHPLTERLRHQLLNFALDNSLLTLNAGQYQLSQSELEENVDSHLIWNTLVREYPDFFSVINIAGSTMLQLAGAFLGQVETDREDQYLTLYNGINDQSYLPVIVQAVKQTISDECQKLVPGQRFRILEVANLQSHYTRDICQYLDFDCCDYSFASANQDTLDGAQYLQEQFHLVELLHLEAADSSLKIAADRQYQLVLISFDHFSIERNLQLLALIKPLLANGATIVLSTMQPIPWLDLSYASTTDWWQRDSSAQASAAQWVSTLQSQNFIAVHSLSALRADSAMTLISAQWQGQSDTDTAVQDNAVHWLVLIGDGHKDQLLGTRIKQAALNATFNVTATDCRERADFVKLFTESAEQGVVFSHIIVATQLGDNQDPLHSQTQRCNLLTQLYIAMESTHCQAKICCITEGVAAILDAAQQQPIAQVPADAAFWGFSRTLMNEAAQSSVQLIDLAVGISAASVDALIKEVNSSTNEREVCLGKTGERTVARLKYEASPLAARSADDSGDAWIKLDFNQPGQLRNLEWQKHPLPTLGSHQIDIAVKATGLNFRDVMYALGLLSDEAIENGFAGASLGLEFSGVIKAVGKDVTNYQVGDDVLGFGSSCFSNRLIATEYSIAPLPEGVSYQGAATIPTTFLTVYYALQHLARLQPGEKVLIHGAAGGVGIAAIQIAQWMGAEIYATVGSEQKREFLQLLGVKHIYNSRDLSFAEQILRDTADGKGVDVVLNSLAGEAIKQNFRVLKPFGRFLELGKRDFYQDSKIGLRPFRNNISYFGIDADQLQQEQPALTARLFSELMALFADGTLSPLPYSEFDAHQVIDAFRYMQQAKQIGKIIVTYDHAITADVDKRKKTDTATLALDGQASYVVSGGLAGFGLQSAKWLVSKGAKNLLLLSRSGPTSLESQQFLEECQQQGVSVHASACDVTDKRALKAALQLCNSELAPIKGIIHAATVIEDSLIGNLNIAQIERSLAAKLQGAQWLDELSRELQLSLEMFVLYSSVTTLWGNPGQAAYVAANHWLEALAATRRSNQLAATCVRWGAIDDVGFLARNQNIKQALQNRLGGSALNSEHGLQIMEQMLLQDSPTLGVLELDWNALSRFLPSADQPKFRELALLAAESEKSEDSQLDLVKMMAEMSEKDLKLAILEVVTHELSDILMLPVSKIDPEKSIYDLGMDSLMGVELMAAVESRIGIRVPVMALTETPKLSQLTDKIISLIQTPEETTDTELEAQIEQVTAQHGATQAMQQSIKNER